MTYIIQLMIFIIPFIAVVKGGKLWMWGFINWVSIVAYTAIINGIGPAMFAMLILAWIYAFFCCGSAYLIKRHLIDKYLSQSKNSSESKNDEESGN